MLAFIVDQDGIIIHALRKVKVDGHNKDVIAIKIVKILYS